MLSSFVAGSTYVFAASAQPGYLPAGISGLRSAAEDDSPGGGARRSSHHWSRRGARGRSTRFAS